MSKRYYPIPGHPGYKISRDGAVWSDHSGRELKPLPYGKGYLGVNLGSQKRYYIHRLMALTFRGPPPSPRHHAAHDNGVRSDNRASNIFWKTPSENSLDKRRHGTWIPKNAILTPADVHEIRRRYVRHRGVAALAAEFGVGAHHIPRIIRGDRWANV